ncbi:MAG TPA: hypothetical protein VNQ90_10135 [Chthoniobacteraceae bacterium]|nr:hypothetical protein [Chthoniobacteraceae bacterium]
MYRSPSLFTLAALLIIAFASGCAPMNKTPLAHYRSEPGPGVPVLHVAPNGSDTATGEAADPLRTVAAAIGKLNGGGVIRLAPGVYRERITVTTRATSKAPLIIEGALSPEGQRLSTVDGSTPLDPALWKPRPDLGPGVYAYPTADPRLLLVDHLSVARLHEEVKPEFIVNGKQEHYLASEVLAWPDDHRVTTNYRKESIPFWETIGGVYSPGKDRKEVYLRLYPERDPRREQTAASPAGPVIALHGSQYVQLRDLAVCGGEYGVEIGGDSALHNTVENCFITHARRRIRVADGAVQTLLKENQLEIGFIGQTPGAWGAENIGSPSERQMAAKKEFVYLYFKYWASPAHISDDVSIVAEKGSRDTTIQGNRLEGGLIGIGLYGGDRVTASGNTIRHFSSVGALIRNGGDVAVYDGNLFDDCNISIRLHSLNAKQQPQRHLWFLRNVSIKESNSSGHIYCHLSPDTHRYPDHQVIFAQNTFINGRTGIGLPPPIQGLPGFQFVNNRFIGCTYVVNGKIDWFRQRSMFGQFDYNQIIGGTIGRHGIPAWYGPHNIDDTQATGWKVGKNGVRLPTPDRGLGAGLDLSRPYELDGKRFSALSDLMPGYPSGDVPPDLGAPDSLPPALSNIYDR